MTFNSNKRLSIFP